LIDQAGMAEANPITSAILLRRRKLFPFAHQVGDGLFQLNVFIGQGLHACPVFYGVTSIFS